MCVSIQATKKSSKVIKSKSEEKASLENDLFYLRLESEMSNNKIKSQKCRFNKTISELLTLTKQIINEDKLVIYLYCNLLQYCIII